MKIGECRTPRLARALRWGCADTLLPVSTSKAPGGFKAPQLDFLRAETQQCECPEKEKAQSLLGTGEQNQKGLWAQTSGMREADRRKRCWERPVGGAGKPGDLSPILAGDVLSSQCEPSPGLSQLLPALAPLQALWAHRGDAALQQTLPRAMAGILSISAEDTPHAQGGAPYTSPVGRCRS